MWTASAPRPVPARHGGPRLRPPSWLAGRVRVAAVAVLRGGGGA